MNLVRAGIVVTTEEENQENDVNLTIFKTIQNIYSFQLLLLSKNMVHNLITKRTKGHN